MLVDERLADGFRELGTLEALVVLLVLRQLIPGRRHELFLLESDDGRPESRRHTVAWVEIQFNEPVRRSGRRDGLQLRIPLPVERRGEDGRLATGGILCSGRVENLPERF